MQIKKGSIKAFNAANYTAAVQLAGSGKGYLEGIAVARNIPAAEMIAGRKAGILLWDEHNPSDAVLFSVFT